MSTVLSSFSNSPEASVFEKSSDRPATSGGSSSVILHPVGIKTTLYKLLPSDYEQIYLRYYMKYSGTDYHHTGGFLGGYYPRTSYPMGDAGLKGIRPDGSRFFAFAFETQGTGQSSWIDTYLNWIDMAGQEIAGGWWGRNMTRDLNIPVRPNVWQCIELMIKMNSKTNVKDGELAIWVDGVQKVHFKPGAPNGKYNSSSGNWEMNSSEPPFPGFLWRDILSYGVNWIKIQNYDDTGTATDMLVDDLVVAKKYIGPINTGSIGPAPLVPKSPKNLRISN